MQRALPKTYGPSTQEIGVHSFPQCRHFILHSINTDLCAHCIVIVSFSDNASTLLSRNLLTLSFELNDVIIDNATTMVTKTRHSNSFITFITIVVWLLKIRFKDYAMFGRTILYKVIASKESIKEKSALIFLHKRSSTTSQPDDSQHITRTQKHPARNEILQGVYSLDYQLPFGKHSLSQCTDVGDKLAGRHFLFALQENCHIHGEIDNLPAFTDIVIA